MTRSIQAGDGDPRHGTENGYKNLYCRCPACREAWRIAYRERSHRVGRNEPREVYVAKVKLLAELADNHGTQTRYSGGCRCEKCRAAATEARRSHRERNREADNAYQREYRRRKAESA